MRATQIVFAAACMATALCAVVRADEPKKEPANALRVSATLVPAREVHVRPKVSGQVVQVLVAEGDQVKAGQVLARLDAAAYELKRKRAQAEVARAEARVVEAQEGAKQGEARIKEAESAVQRAVAANKHHARILERLNKLLNQGSVDARLVQEAEATAQAADAKVKQTIAQVEVLRAAPNKTAVDITKAELAAAKAQYELAKLRVDGATLRAPIDGTVLTRRVAVGDAVGPQPAEGRATPLFTVADLSQLDAVADVPERDVAHLTVGQPCELRLAALPGQVVKGQLVRISPVISRQTGTARAQVRLEVPKGSHLLPGMCGTLSILPKP